MNARELEIRHERALDALQDAADMEQERNEERIKMIASQLPFDFVKMPREQLMFKLWDAEFGGEYFSADLVMTYSMWAIGSISNEEMIRRIHKTMQDAMYAQADWECL